jgi:hypothetical protein
MLSIFGVTLVLYFVKILSGSKNFVAKGVLVLGIPLVTVCGYKVRLFS